METDIVVAVIWDWTENIRRNIMDPNFLDGKNIMQRMDNDRMHKMMWEYYPTTRWKWCHSRRIWKAEELLSSKTYFFVKLLLTKRFITNLASMNNMATSQRK